MFNKRIVRFKSQGGFGTAGAIIVLAVLFILFIGWMYKDGLFAASEQALISIGVSSRAESSVLNKETRNLTKPIPGK